MSLRFHLEASRFNWLARRLLLSVAFAFALRWHMDGNEKMDILFDHLAPPSLSLSTLMFHSIFPSLFCTVCSLNNPASHEVHGEPCQDACNNLIGVGHSREQCFASTGPSRIP